MGGAIVSLGAFTAMADDFVVPEAEICMPIPGQTTYYGAFSVTWGYYGLEKNAEQLTGEITFPDGTSRSLTNGRISNANLEGALEGSRELPTTEDNSINYQAYNVVDDIIVSLDGEYKVEIPAGIVLVNGVENPAASLTFVIGDTNAVKAAVDLSENPVIYDIHGVAQGTDISALPAGLYVIGNKKVYLRK